MPGDIKVCSSKGCNVRFSPTRKGCGGRQYVLPEYVQFAPELLKDGAAEGDWICVTCRNTIRLRSATFGAAVNGDGQVRVAAEVHDFELTEVVVMRTGAGGRSTASQAKSSTTQGGGSRVRRGTDAWRSGDLKAPI